MYKTIHEHPTAEQIVEFGMQANHEDMFTDYRININTLSDEKKKRLCDLYRIDFDAITGKESLILSVASEV